MIYVTYSKYTAIYGEKIEESLFNLVAFDACKLADRITTGVDGVKKLKIAFPTDEDDAEAVTRAICGVIDLMATVKRIEDDLVEAGSFVKADDGTIRYKVIDSVSSGSESIHFATGGTSTLASALVADYATRQEIYKQMLTDNLRGVNDDNGVNLLYMGMYPVE